MRKKEKVEILVSKEQARALENIKKISKTITELELKKADIEQQLDNLKSLIKAEQEIAAGLVGHPFLS